MASMRDIKRRRESIQSTQQITKAMKLVSTVKLQRAKLRAENSKPYFDKMYETVTSILAKSGTIEHPYLTPSDSPKKAVILVTSNRGLAGGYNSNVIKTVTEADFNKEDVVIYSVGNKGSDFLGRRGYEIAKNCSDMIEDPTFEDAKALGREVLESYRNGEVGEIYLAYTKFKNTVVHVPQMVKLLPVDIAPEDVKAKEEQVREEKTGVTVPMNYEPEPEEALEMIIPNYINSLIYGAFMEAVASENGARMQAMDAATSNADEMISTLSLAYNRARQGAITQELTEIISGAEALN